MDCLIVDFAEGSGGWGKRLLADMSVALAAHGVAVTTILEEADADRHLANFMAALPAHRYFLLIDGMCRANKFITDPRAIRFSFIVDHPAYLMKDFEGTRVGNLMGFIDESHLAAADRLGVPFPKFFFPHAGPPPEQAIIPLADRPIDVLVCCRFTEPLTDAEWRAEHPDVPAVVADALLEAADRLATSLTTSLSAWDEACNRQGFDAGARLPPTELARVVVSIEHLATARRRRDVLSGLADHVPMHLASPAVPSYLRDRPNIVWGGGLTFDELLPVFASAKVVINPVARFAYGSHERIWYPMAHGCIVATDESPFLQRYFADGESLLILPWGAEQEEFRRRLARLLQQPARMDAMQQAATPIYARHHTWYQRVIPLVELMRQLDQKVAG